MDIDSLQVWAPTLATVAVFLCLAWLPPRDETRFAARFARVCAALFAAGVILRYAVWRVQALPVDQMPLRQAWSIFFLVMEMLNVLSNMLVLFFMSRTSNRTADADAALDSPLIRAPTDVFIATYNEPRSVLERTIVGALDIDHPDLRVWVLDDGARPWVQELAEELGAHYLFRVKGKHAKAGNINNGLAHVLSHGRRPQFILVLDADFIASRQFLRRTLGLFETPDVGIVQTPQHFFNPDPVQINLGCTHVWPDEQRFFFNVLMPSQDAWGAAFCCGTSSVLRVEALESIGGMATETVTEDALTSFKMRAHGWRTIFLNERLSLGLAPEGLSEYVMQRGRWCLGAIQQLHTPWSWFGRAPIGLINRLSNFATMLFWMISFPFKLMVLACPGIYWLTGSPVIQATIPDLLYWLLPSVLASILFMSIYGRNLVIPIMTDITQILSAVVVVANVITGVFRPHGRAFKVTDKGVARQQLMVRWQLMWPFLLIAVLTLIGVAVNASPLSPLAGSDGYDMNVFWSIFNIAILSLACLACIELPRRRTEERFASNERGVVIWPGRAGAECRVRDISLGGARLVAARWDRVEPNGVLSLDDGHLQVPFSLLRQQDREVVIRFDCSPALRRSLIGRLFGGAYAQELERVAMHRVMGTLLRRLVG
ncbi:MAG TPA: glycosyltransferase [Rhodopila sp.]|nr:glycosyltransferase [Rhodopila sp.]